MKRLVNLAGFWMAVFSLAGLMMLSIAGPIVQKRLSRHKVPLSEMAQPANSMPSAKTNLGNGNSQRHLEVYSLTGLRWTLAGFLVLGVGWACISITKTEFESPDE